MNLRLVESIAQIVLAMSAEERQHFEQLINRVDSLEWLNSLNKTNNKSESELNKDAQIAQIAQQMQSFEEKHSVPSSPLTEYRQEG